MTALKVGIISISFHIWLIRYKNLQNIYFFLDGIWYQRGWFKLHYLNPINSFYFTVELFSCNHLPDSNTLGGQFAATIFSQITEQSHAFHEKMSVCCTSLMSCHRLSRWAIYWLELNHDNHSHKVTSLMTASQNKTLAPLKCQSEILWRKTLRF